MPTMPTKASLSYAVPQPVRPMAHAKGFDVAGTGLQAIGHAMTGIGLEEKRKDDALDLIKAEAEQRKGLNEIMRDLTNDTDYNTYQQRFGERAQALNERTSSMIRDPQMRERWGIKSGMENESHLNSLLNHGQALKRQDQNVQLEDSLNTHLQTFTDPASTEVQRREAKQRMKESIGIASKSGIVNPMHGRKLYEKYAGQADEYMIRQRIINGEDLGSILKDIRGTGRPSGSAAIVAMTGKFETGKSDPLEGVGSYSKDSKNTTSYGNLGLNSGGSVQEFVKKYGADFGLTATPGTAEFNKQWQNAAKAAPVEMHAAEVDWFENNIAPRIAGDLVSAGAPRAFADDPRVQAYFADRMIQYGPGSILTYKKRIEAAAKDSETPEEFMSKMGGADRGSIKSDFQSAIATVPKTSFQRQRYIGGLESRVGKREAGALGIDDRGGPYPDLTPHQRNTLTDDAKIAYREVAKQEINDAAVELRRTGQMPRDAQGRTALDKAAAVLTPNQMTKERLKLLGAGAEHAATSPLQDMTESQGNDWVDRLNPTFHNKGEQYPLDGVDPEEHYAIASNSFDKADEKWKGVLSKRSSDPSSAVDGSREVMGVRQELLSSGRGMNVVQAHEKIIEARMAAMERLQIPPFQRRIITSREATSLLGTARDINPDEIDKIMKEASVRAQATYGKYAKEALRSAISLRVNSQANRDEMGDLISIGGKTVEKPKPQGWMDSIMGYFEPTKIETKELKPTPNDAQIKWVEADPKNRAPVFDRMFGEGSYSKLTAQRAQGAQ